MATRHNATGIVLRRTDYGEADRILTLLTRELGKVTAIAKGVRKLQSKMAGGVELLSISELGLIPGKSMYTLTSARTKQQFSSIAKNLVVLNLVYDFLKLINSTVEDGKGAELFSVVEQAFFALDESVDANLVKVWFYMQLLTHYGQQPNLTHDINGVELGADLTYILQPSSGALLPSESDAAFFDSNAIKSLRLMNRYDPRQLKEVSGVVQSAANIAEQIEAFANYQLN